MDGFWEGWFENGYKKYENNYKAGKLNGLCLMFWEETGKMHRQGKYANDLKNGVWNEYAQNGHILSKGKYSKDLKEGKWVFYNMHEKKIREQNFVHDVPEGVFTEYYDNGMKHTQGAYKNRLRHGKWSSWNPQGKLTYSAIFDNGHKVKEIYVTDPKKTPF